MLGALSCAAVLGFEELADGPPVADAAPTPDAGGDAEPDGEAPAPCGLGEPPDAALGTLQHHFSVSALNFEAEAPRQAAFNLDCVDTKNASQPTCALLADLSRSIDYQAVVDQAGGVDNAFGALFATLSGPLGFEELGYQNRQASIVFDVAGMAEPGSDTRVLRIVARPGSMQHAEGDGGRRCAPWPAQDYSAAADYDDRWCVDANLSDLSRAAWVEGGGKTLKARFDLLHLPILPDGPPRPAEGHILSYITVRNVVLVAELSQVDGRYRLSGHLAGSWNVDEFVEQLTHIKECATQELPSGFDTYLKMVCEVRDMRTDSELGAEQPCDALSVVMSFRAYEVQAPHSVEMRTYADCAATAVANDAGAKLNPSTCEDVLGVTASSSASSFLPASAGGAP